MFRSLSPDVHNFVRSVKWYQVNNVHILVARVISGKIILLWYWKNINKSNNEELLICYRHPYLQNVDLKMSRTNICIICYIITLHCLRKITQGTHRYNQ